MHGYPAEGTSTRKHAVQLWHRLDMGCHTDCQFPMHYQKKNKTIRTSLEESMDRETIRETPSEAIRRGSGRTNHWGNTLPSKNIIQSSRRQLLYMHAAIPATRQLHLHNAIQAPRQLHSTIQAKQSTVLTVLLTILERMSTNLVWFRSPTTKLLNYKSTPLPPWCSLFHASYSLGGKSEHSCQEVDGQCLRLDSLGW